jgi:hypothetical protein
LGSRYDPVAAALVEALPGAALCGADDLTRAGWRWPLACGGPRRWVIEGTIVDDREVTGVLVRRTWVHPEELVHTHGDDREYLAAETLAFLTFVLAQTGARVVNPAQGGAIGEEIFRLERWLPAAVRVGLAIRPLRLSPLSQEGVPERTFAIEIVGEEAFGSPAPELVAGSIALARLLGLAYGVFAFDAANRLMAISAGSRPSPAAIPALAALLASRPPG